MAAKLVISAVNGGANPRAGTGDAVTVTVQDVGGFVRNVAANTGVTLSLANGTAGSLGGTQSGIVVSPTHILAWATASTTTWTAPAGVAAIELLVAGGGNGGNGLTYSISGAAVTYAGGGGGSSLPVATSNAGTVTIEFTCLKPGELGTAILEMQYSNDLGAGDPWYSAVVPGADATVNHLTFTVTSYDATHNHVIAEIPQPAASGGRLFGRLRATGP